MAKSKWNLAKEVGMEERFLPPHNTYEIVIGIGAGLNPSNTNLSNATREVVAGCRTLCEGYNESGDPVISDCAMLLGRPPHPITQFNEAEAMSKLLNPTVLRLAPPISYYWNLEAYARLIARILVHEKIKSAVVVADHLMAHRVEHVFQKTLTQDNQIQMIVWPTFSQPEANPTLASRLQQVGNYIAAAYYKAGNSPAYR